MSALPSSALLFTLLFTLLNTYLSLAEALSQTYPNTVINHASAAHRGGSHNNYQPIENEHGDVMSHQQPIENEHGDVMSQLLHPQNSGSFDTEKRTFKFGKRLEEDSGSDIMAENVNKKAFKFGKKSDFTEIDPELEAEKKAFKFGKRWIQPLDYKRGGFKFGKRSSLDNVEDIYEDNDAEEEKRAFKFGKRADRMFKFGKRSADTLLEPQQLDEQDWTRSVERPTFIYSRLPPLYEALGFSDHGPKPSGHVTIDDKRAFKFGKRVFVDSIPQEEALYNLNESPQGYWEGREDGLDQAPAEDKRAFKFGKRPYDSSWLQQLYRQQQRQLRPQLNESESAADRRRFLFKLGKRQFKFGK